MLVVLNETQKEKRESVKGYTKMLFEIEAVNSY